MDRKSLISDIQELIENADYVRYAASDCDYVAKNIGDEKTAVLLRCAVSSAEQTVAYLYHAIQQAKDPNYVMPKVECAEGEWDVDPFYFHKKKGKENG
jgi:hypothetical protein